MTPGIEALAPAVMAFLVGFLARADFEEWLARRRYRCEVCGSRTTDDGIGAQAALDAEDEDDT